MKKIVIITAFASLLFAFVVKANEKRTWTSAHGQHKIEGEFVGISEDGKSVIIQKTITVPLEKLSQADQDFIARQKEANPPNVQAQRAVNPPAEQAAVIPDQTAILSSPEAIKIRQQIDIANQFGNESYFKNITEHEKEVIIQFLIRARKEGVREIDTKSSMFCYLDEIFGFNESRRVPIDQYTCNVARIKQLDVVNKEKNRSLLENMLPESNRLSGNRYDVAENARLNEQSAFAPIRPTKQAPKLPDSPEKALLRRKIDTVNSENDGSFKVKLSEEEKDAVAHYLFLAERALKKKKTEAGISLMLSKLNDFKGSLGRYNGDYKGGYKKYVEIDVYVACLAGYDTAVSIPSSFNANVAVYDLMKADQAIIESLLPECNRLSGNAHDDDEKNRLEDKRLEAEKKNLFDK